MKITLGLVIGSFLLLGAMAYLVVRALRERRKVKALEQRHRPTQVMRRVEPERAEGPGEGEGADEGDGLPEVEAEGEGEEAASAPAPDPQPRPRQRRPDPFARQERPRRRSSGKLTGILIVLAVAAGVILIANEVRKRYMTKPPVVGDPCAVCKVDKVSIDQLTCERVGEKKWQFFGHKCVGSDACAACRVGNCFSDDIDTPPADDACNICVTPSKRKASQPVGD